MTIYDLYGSLSADIDEAKALLEAAIGIQFEAHDSSYQGGGYLRSGKVTGEHFVLKRNLDPFDDEPAELSFPDHAILLYVNDTLRSADLRNSITLMAGSFALLRHEEL
ncbi:hypothetical protein OKW30_000772 [Paraburkholderia sp. Clong3]|uniref:hypothetical protein n=1 Tax=Paraburkholderia sp. Clong3 TaxID=2991061 RepID=UPI003D1A1E86